MMNESMFLGDSIIDNTMRAFLRNSQDYIFVKDLSLRYVIVSAAFARLVGYDDPAKLEGKTDYDIFSKELADQYAYADKNVLESGTPIINRIEPLPSPDEMPHFSATSKHPIYDRSGKLVAMYGIGRDITETQSLRRAANQAHIAKQSFLAKMSHDMRTPMNGMIGIVHLLLQEDLPSHVHADLENIRMTGDYLLNLIDDTLDMSNINEHRMALHLQPTDSRALMDSVLGVVKPTIAQKNLRFRTMFSGVDFNTVWLDHVRMQQLFVNVLSNAVKFTPPGGEIVFCAECLSRTAESIYEKFTIRDNGIGMSEAFLPHLFEPFSQENKGVQNYAGAGLGMAIVKQVTDLMGGKIEVESQKGVGTSVSIFLPIKISSPAADNHVPAHALGQSVLLGRHFLICEDHALNASILRRLLEAKGCQSTIAENGAIGVEQFTASAPGTYDAILMDIRMPVMDGLEAARTIRHAKHPDAAKIPIIATTANAFDADKVSSAAAGMNAHLSKPITPTALYSTLAALLEKEASGQPALL